MNTNKLSTIISRLERVSDVYSKRISERERTFYFGSGGLDYVEGFGGERYRDEQEVVVFVHDEPGMGVKASSPEEAYSYFSDSSSPNYIAEAEHLQEGKILLDSPNMLVWHFKHTYYAIGANKDQVWRELKRRARSDM